MLCQIEMSKDEKRFACRMKSKTIIRGQLDKTGQSGMLADTESDPWRDVLIVP